MQFVVAWRVIVACAVGLAAGCARAHVNPMYTADVDRVLAAHASSDQQIAAPTSLEPKPWKVGAWALYKRGGRYAQRGSQGYEKVSVVAADPCGIWIVDESHGYHDQHRWTICLRPMAPGSTDGSTDPVDLVQVAIWESNGGPPSIVDFRSGQHPKERAILKPVLARLFPPRGLGHANLPREDVTVPAGHFAQTIRTTETLDPAKSLEVTRWSHPDVPFDATVKRRTSDGREHVLLAYGDDGAASIVPSLASALASAMQPKPTPSNFTAIGIGFGWFSGSSNEQSSQASKFGLTAGLRVRPKIDLIGEVGGLVGADYSPDPLLGQSALVVLLGARWAPFRLPHLQARPLPRGASALYVQADLGYTQLFRDTMNDTSTVARGFVVGAALGWLGFQGRDWAFGLELNDHLAFFNSGEGIRHSVGLMAVWQLYRPWGR